MNIWIIKDSEPVEFIGSSNRLFRYSSLAIELLNRGHEVHLITSNYSHFKKKYIKLDETTTAYTHLYIHQLKTISYKNHVSISRLMNHIFTSLSFIHNANRFGKPDLILVSVPIIELAFFVSIYSKIKNIVLICDIVDLWPDIFKTVFRKRVFLLFFPYYFLLNIMLKFTLRTCNSLTALSEPYLEWAVKKRSYINNISTEVFHLGYKQDSSPQIKVSKKEGLMKVLFVGSINRQFDFLTVFKAAKDERLRNVKFVFIGQGDMMNYWQKETEGLSNVEWKGWLEGIELKNHFEDADLALLPYIEVTHFLSNITNKFSEYLAYGLPILSSISGEMGKLIVANKCGDIYLNADDLVQKLQCYTNDFNKFSHYSKNALKLHKKMFDIELINESFSRYIEGIFTQNQIKRGFKL
jgi:glycosyltransferase involved in cell wall biosynthesis